MSEAATDVSQAQSGMGEAKRTIKRDLGLDLLKALSICLVVVWHVKPIMFERLGPGKAFFILQGLNVTFWREVTLVAVPTFYIVSLYLFLKKACGGMAYFRNRTRRLIYIFLFWTAVHCLFYVAVAGGLPEFSWDTLRQGGPKVPGYGYNGFYFVFNLILLNFVASLYAMLDAKRQDILDAVVIVGSLLFFEVAALSDAWHVSHASMANFFIYIPLARQLAVRREAFISRRWLLTGLYAVFALQDVAMQMMVGQGSEAYTRPTVVFGSLALVTWVFFLKVESLPRWGQLLSIYSLGIYATHLYAKHLAGLLLPPDQYWALGNAGFLWTSLVQFFLACVLVALILRVLDRSPLRSFVR